MLLKQENTHAKLAKAIANYCCLIKLKHNSVMHHYQSLALKALLQIVKVTMVNTHTRKGICLLSGGAG